MIPLFNFDPNMKMLTSSSSKLSQTNLVNSLKNSSSRVKVNCKLSGENIQFEVEQVDEVYGKIQSWRFRPTQESVKRIPQLSDILMVIVNE